MNQRTLKQIRCNKISIIKQKTQLANKNKIILKNGGGYGDKKRQSENVINTQHANNIINLQNKYNEANTLLLKLNEKKPTFYNSNYYDVITYKLSEKYNSGDINYYTINNIKNLIIILIDEFKTKLFFKKIVPSTKLKLAKILEDIIILKDNILKKQNKINNKIKPDIEKEFKELLKSSITNDNSDSISDLPSNNSNSNNSNNSNEEYFPALGPKPIININNIENDNNNDNDDIFFNAQESFNAIESPPLPIPNSTVNHDNQDIYILLIRAHGKLPIINTSNRKNQDMATIIEEQYLVKKPENMEDIIKITSAEIGDTNCGFYEYETKKNKIQEIFLDNNDNIDKLSETLSEKIKQEEIEILKKDKINFNHIKNRHNITRLMLNKLFTIYSEKEQTLRSITDTYQPFFIMKKNNKQIIEDKKTQNIIKDTMNYYNTTNITLENLIFIINKTNVLIKKLIIMDFSCSSSNDEYLTKVLKRNKFSGGTYKDKKNKPKKTKTKKTKTKKTLKT